jgi:NAD(P)-dependent dehydrogenase (short-subunit alcohol dehydrogenase family)
MKLKDRVVIVTGAAGEIGRVYVRRLVEEGARVAVVDLELDRAGETAIQHGSSDQVIGIAADVSDRDSAQRMARETLEAFGRIDVLVNNAAVFATLEHKPIEEISVEEWDLVMAVNVRGVFLCAQAVIPQMRRQGKGKIVNIASGVLLSAPSKFSHYVTSKGAVFAFTRALANEVGRDGIRVNSLAPGLVATDAVRITHPPEGVERQLQIRPLARDMHPEDLEGALVFLCSDDSDFMTGQMVLVNGGAQFW